MITGVTVHVENLSALPSLQQGSVSKHIVDMGGEPVTGRKVKLNSQLFLHNAVHAFPAP